MIFASVSTGLFHRGMELFSEKEIMRSGSAASLDLIVEACVRMCVEDHVAGAIENAVSRVSGAVIQNLVNGFICALCVRRLLLTNSAEADE